MIIKEGKEEILFNLYDLGYRYIARNKDTKLRCFFYEPDKVEDIGCWRDCDGHLGTLLDELDEDSKLKRHLNEILHFVTWESSIVVNIDRTIAGLAFLPIGGALM